MGKKSKRYREKRQQYEQNLYKEEDPNMDMMTADLDRFASHLRSLDLPSVPSTGKDCKSFHGDPLSEARTELQKRKGLDHATKLADYAQCFYHIQEPLVSKNSIPAFYIKKMDIHNKGHIFNTNFPRAACASATTDYLINDMEACRAKVDLAITTDAYVTHGKGLDLTALLTLPPSLQPEWVQAMVRKMEYVRQSHHHLTIFLASKIPCNCLETAAQKAKDELEKNPKAGSLEKDKTCMHDSPVHMPEDWLSRNRRLISSSALRMKDSVRDFDELVEFMQNNPKCASIEFVRLANAMAVETTLERKSEFAERYCNLALIAEVFYKYGAAQVLEDLRRMEEENIMPPYLYDLYIGLRTTSDLTSGLVRLVGKRVSCDCLCDTRAKFHGFGGDQRSTYCDVCQNVYPKNQFRTCGKCEIEKYCSRECQVKDWPTHKQTCKRLCSVLKKNTKNPMAVGDVMLLEGLQSKPDWNGLLVKVKNYVGMVNGVARWKCSLQLENAEATDVSISVQNLVPPDLSTQMDRKLSIIE